MKMSGDIFLYHLNEIGACLLFDSVHRSFEASNLCSWNVLFVDHGILSISKMIMVFRFSFLLQFS